MHLKDGDGEPHSDRCRRSILAPGLLAANQASQEVGCANFPLGPLLGQTHCCPQTLQTHFPEPDGSRMLSSAPSVPVWFIYMCV